MRVLLYKRHTATCERRADPNYRRCGCAVWLQWNQHGEQTRKSAKTRSWEMAEQRARKLEQQYLDVELGNAAPGAPTTVAAAIALFLDSKRGTGGVASNTLYKYGLTLARLQAFCDAKDIIHVKDITLSQLTTWRATWPFESPLAQRNNQARVKGFFKYCTNAGLILTNPTLQLSGIEVKVDEASRVRPFEPKEYQKILDTVDKCGLQPRNAARVKACMQLQRWSGLSLVDAVCLSTDELQWDGKKCRVRTKRRKTGVPINNRIPAALGKELLKGQNGNRQFVFISGEATPKGAVSTFDKMYRQVFRAAGVNGTSHMFRHTFSVELLKADTDIRKVSKALGHRSVTITERYYAKWNKAQQDILDRDLEAAFGKYGR